MTIICAQAHGLRLRHAAAAMAAIAIGLAIATSAGRAMTEAAIIAASECTPEGCL